MQSKNIYVIGVFVLMLGWGVGLARAEGPIQQREENQEKRIDAGINSGAVNPNEAAKLAKGEAKIEQNREKALADGKVTAKEHRKLEKQANRESRKIYRAKHNKK